MYLYLLKVLTWFTSPSRVVPKLIYWTCLHTNITGLIQWHLTVTYEDAWKVMPSVLDIQSCQTNVFKHLNVHDLNCNTEVIKILLWNVLYTNSCIIGTSLSEPHTSMTALRTCMCMFACLLGPTTYYKFQVNARVQCQWPKTKTTEVEARVAT